MISRKYAKDYKLEYAETLRGGIKSVPLYIGKYYGYVSGEALPRRALLFHGAAAGVVALLLLAALMLPAPVSRHLYVALPHVLCALSTGYVISAVIGMAVKKPPFTRQTAEHISGRLRRAALANLFFSAAALAGGVTAAAVFGVGGGFDLVYLILLLLQTAASALQFSRRGDADTAEIP